MSPIDFLEMLKKDYALLLKEETRFLPLNQIPTLLRNSSHHPELMTTEECCGVQEATAFIETSLMHRENENQATWQTMTRNLHPPKSAAYKNKKLIIALAELEAFQVGAAGLYTLDGGNESTISTLLKKYATLTRTLSTSQQTQLLENLESLHSEVAAFSNGILRNKINFSALRHALSLCFQIATLLEHPKCEQGQEAHLFNNCLLVQLQRLPIERRRELYDRLFQKEHLFWPSIQALRLVFAKAINSTTQDSPTHQDLTANLQSHCYQSDQPNVLATGALNALVLFPDTLCMAAHRPLSNIPKLTRAFQFSAKTRADRNLIENLCTLVSLLFDLKHQSSAKKTALHFFTANVNKLVFHSIKQSCKAPSQIEPDAHFCALVQNCIKHGFEALNKCFSIEMIKPENERETTPDQELYLACLYRLHELLQAVNDPCFQHALLLITPKHFANFPQGVTLHMAEMTTTSQVPEYMLSFALDRKLQPENHQTFKESVFARATAQRTTKASSTLAQSLFNTSYSTITESPSVPSTTESDILQVPSTIAGASEIPVSYIMEQDLERLSFLIEGKPVTPIAHQSRLSALATALHSLCGENADLTLCVSKLANQSLANSISGFFFDQNLKTKSQEICHLRPSHQNEEQQAQHQDFFIARIDIGKHTDRGGVTIKLLYRNCLQEQWLANGGREININPDGNTQNFEEVSAILLVTPEMATADSFEVLQYPESKIRLFYKILETRPHSGLLDTPSPVPSSYDGSCSS